ncbi:MAG TPA: YqcC family protein [Anaerolineales bacterium]
MKDKQAIVEEKISAIEAELRRIGLWQEEPLPKEAYDYTLAFAQDSMAFHQWLQFIFIPQVRNLIESYDEFPKMSQVSAAAVRAFDGWDKANRLIILLKEFDNLFTR